MPWVRDVFYYYLESLLNKSDVTLELEKLASIMDATGEDLTFFFPLDSRVKEYVRFNIKETLNASLKSKRLATFKIFGRNLFGDKFTCETVYGFYMTGIPVETTDTSPIRYTDEGLYTDSEGQLPAVLYKVIYDHDTLDDINNILIYVAEMVSIFKPGRIMVWFMPSLYPQFNQPALTDVPEYWNDSDVGTYNTSERAFLASADPELIIAGYQVVRVSETEGGDYITPDTSVSFLSVSKEGLHYEMRVKSSVIIDWESLWIEIPLFNGQTPPAGYSGFPNLLLKVSFSFPFYIYSYTPEGDIFLQFDLRWVIP
jgi:hypothetical protein